MNEHEALIDRFYQAFQRRDGAAMAACYHADATFSDPVFQGLRGKEPGAMWQMLCERGKDLKVVYSGVRADDRTGSAHWDATYTFGPTGRAVLNKIDAAFTFKDGKILDHKDQFDLWRWSRQALGPIGLLLGWSPFVANKIRKTARQGLDAYLTRRA